MLGGFNSVKRENHHYKYAHCETINELKAVNQNYNIDLTIDGEWNYAVTQLKDKKAFKGNINLVKFNADIPNITDASNFFDGCTKLKYISMDMSHITNVSMMFYNCALVDIPECFNPNTRDFSRTFDANYWSNNINNTTYISYNKAVDEITSTDFIFRGAGHRWAANGLTISDKYKFENLTSAWGMFNNQWPYGRGFSGDIKLNLISLSYAPDMFANAEQMKSFSSPLPKLDNAKGMFKRANAAYNNHFEFVSELPLLSNGDGMFAECKLSKNSVLRISNSLPSYTDGSSHKITIGIHKDLYYDPEVHAALKKVDVNYQIPSDIEIVEPSENKGWTLTVGWHGTISSKEFIKSEKIAKLDLDSITLPYGYKRCEYLESDTNNQYIDTEIIPTNTTGTWIIAKRISETVDGYSIAVRTNSNYYYPPMLRSNGNYHGWGTTTEWTDFTKQNIAFESYINYPINGTITKEAVAIDNAGTSVTKALTTNLPTISHSLYMFGRNYNGTLERQWNGRIYRVKISEGDQIIRDFIPALDPDGKPCMYEMVEGKPYYNAATSGNDFLYKIYEDYVMPELPPYDIVEGSKYIPDASSWNSTAYADLTAEDKTIIRVVNGIAYDE